MPLAASNLLFQGNEIQKDVLPHYEKEDDNHSNASGGTHDEDQKYWYQSTEEYNDVVVGPEIFSSIASATKIFWEKPLSEDKLKSKIESGKLPANCGFMKTKRCNKSGLHWGTEFVARVVSYRKFRNCLQPQLLLL